MEEEKTKMWRGEKRERRRAMGLGEIRVTVTGERRRKRGGKKQRGEKWDMLSIQKAFRGGMCEK